MAIFRKTEPGLLYELSPGRDGRLLVWSPGLMKYKDCTSLADMSNVNSNYLEEDIDDGCWFYQLPSLVNGDNMFYNDTIDTLYEGRSPLWHFEANLQSLQSGVNMFKGCSLDAVSVKRIADTLPNTSTGTITLGIHYTLEGDSSVAALLTKIKSKGWSVETEYNLPYERNLPYGFTELEYLESSGTQYINVGIAPSTYGDSIGMAIKVYFVNDRASHDLDCGIIGSRLNVLEKEFQITSYTYGRLRWGSRDISLAERFLPQRTAVFTLENLSYVLIEENQQNVTGTLPAGQELSPLPISLFALNTQNGIVQFGSIRVFYLTLYNGEQRIIDYVPALDASGTPCMYDKVSHTCFYNNGTGTFGYKIKRTGAEVEPATFSLRDPYYVAPSGVYARPSGENELDIIADTDMTADVAEQEGYIWFANTGEAYEHFGITQQSEEEEVIDA